MKLVKLLIISAIFASLSLFNSMATLYIQNRASYPIFYTYSGSSTYEKTVKPPLIGKESIYSYQMFSGKIAASDGGSHSVAKTITGTSCKSPSNHPYACFDYVPDWNITIYKPTNNEDEANIVTEDGMWVTATTMPHHNIKNSKWYIYAPDDPDRPDFYRDDS